MKNKPFSFVNEGTLKLSINTDSHNILRRFTETETA